MSVKDKLKPVVIVQDANLEAELKQEFSAEVATFPEIKQCFDYLDAHPSIPISFFIDQESTAAYELLSDSLAEQVINNRSLAVVSRSFNWGSLILAHEFGLFYFSSVPAWLAATADEPDSVPSELLQLNKRAAQAFKVGDVSKLKIVKDEFIRCVRVNDVHASYFLGLLNFALSEVETAKEQFEFCLRTHANFVPARMKLAECLMWQEKFLEAQAILQRLDQGCPWSLERKVLLLGSYLETDNAKDAKVVLERTTAIAPKHPKTEELSVLMLLAEKNVDEVMKKIAQLNRVGLYTATKLNELGIKLSTSGRGQLSLTLYDITHKSVFPELKYKISLNAALAAHRLGDHDRALSYVDRCQSEYGGSFAKLDKIRKAIVQRRGGGHG